MDVEITRQELLILRLMANSGINPCFLVPDNGICEAEQQFWFAGAWLDEGGVEIEGPDSCFAFRIDGKIPISLSEKGLLIGTEDKGGWSRPLELCDKGLQVLKECESVDLGVDIPFNWLGSFHYLDGERCFGKLTCPDEVVETPPLFRWSRK